MPIPNLLQNRPGSFSCSLGSIDASRFTRKYNRLHVALLKPRPAPIVNVMVKPSYIASQRPCPNCGGAMFYRSSLSTMLTGLRRRICSVCGYKDPKRVKIVREDGSS
jgi:predicted RNA-binding Zn-ribbon protein involved in translation (DUF1610 family)